jgi:tryptophanyl-tRNA synthetase
MKKVLSGIRASGNLHLGNYLGAVKGMLDLQNDSGFETYYMVADLHGITAPYDKNKFAGNVKSVIKDYLACGLDPKKSTLFIQSTVPQHLELFYLFTSVTNVAKMQHLPTYKDEIKKHPENITMALLNYPVLMAADILAYKASHVPVGVDQEPHIEVARDIAKKMNAKYGTNFPEPVRFKTSGEYVPSLLGEGKMAKSIEGSAIFLTDSLDEIKSKVAKIPTDCGKGENIPTTGGVASFLKFVELFEGKEVRSQYEFDYTKSGLRYGDAKSKLATAIYNFLKPIQEKRVQIEKDIDFVNDVINEGTKKAQATTIQTVNEVKELMGLRY